MHSWLTVGGITPDCATKAREPIYGGKCHHVTPPSITASFSPWLVPCRALQCHSAVTLSLFTSVLAFFLFVSLFQLVSLLLTPSSRPSPCLSKQLQTEAVFFSVLYLLQQPSKCYPCDFGCFTSMPTYFHSSLGTTLFPLVIPQLNSESELLFHSLALCATFSASIYFLSFFPPFFLFDWQCRFSDVVMEQNLWINRT